MFAIESGVEKPERVSQARTDVEDTINKMEVGDSFVVSSQYKAQRVKKIAKEMKRKMSSAPEGEKAHRCWLDE